MGDPAPTDPRRHEFKTGSQGPQSRERLASPPLNAISLRSLTVLSVIGALGGVVLMAVRAYFAISFTEPMQGMTRGVEYEPLYSIWLYINGQPVYSSQHDIPFTASFYNWLFYAAYGEIARVALAVFDLGDAWLPTIARLTTLAGACAGTILTHRSFVDLLDIQEIDLRILAGAFSAFLFFGPLIGFFGIATAPDIWPMVFTVAAIWAFISGYERRPIFAILIVCLFSYLAWGFKQNFIYIPATVGVFLLLRRDWRAALLLVAVMVSAGVLTLIVGGESYARMLYFGGTAVFFGWEQWTRIFLSASVKSLPLLATLVALTVLFVTSATSREAMLAPIRRRPVFLVPLLGVPVAAAEALPTSAIVNAAENHYFSLAYFLVFALFALVVWAHRANCLGRATHGIMAAGWVLHILAIATVLAGFQGVLSVRPQHDLVMARKACIEDLTQPAFVAISYLALPWIMPAKQHFVVHNSYLRDRAHGIEKVGGGLGGLIDRGYFATVVLPQGMKGSYDGSDLSLYRPREEACHGLVIYDRTRDGKKE